MNKGYVNLLIIFTFCLSSSFITSSNVSNSPSKEGKVDYLSPLEHEVIAELNLARTEPKVYAGFLASYSSYFVGRELHEPGMTILLTKEGKSAVIEAIRFLKGQKPMAVLTPSKGMSMGAGDMVRMQEKTSQTGHKGIDGSSFTERISRYGTWNGLCSENIDYGNNNARRIVMALIIDDGVSSRGHRKSIFEPSFRRVGVAFGGHRTYNYMCVIEYAVSFTEFK